MDEKDETEESSGGGAGIQVDLLKSYLAFARRAIIERWLTAAIIGFVGVVLTALMAIYLPRSFSCTTVLMTLGNPVLDSRDTNNALTGAADLILRHENLEAMITDLNLVKEAEARRPPLMRLKDRAFRSLLGEPDNKIKIAALVGTLKTKLTVTAEKGDLTIKAEWSDARTATQLAETARESFLKTRHNAEISAFEEKMAILDGHAAKLREEIGGFAQQLKAARDAKLTDLRAEARATAKANEPAPAPRPVYRPAAPAEADTTTPALKEKLATLTAKLATVEADQTRRVQEAQAKYDEMKLRLTPMHPELITQAERVAMAQQVPSEVQLLRSEVKNVQDELQVREGMVPGRSGDVGGGGSRTPRTAGAELLPPDINELLQRDNLDPALTAQLSGSVLKYATLRNDLLSTRIDLDTAQAAFNHRYQVIVPAEMPNKPDKPKPGLVWGAGLFLSLLIALGVPVLRELRRGIMVEKWQVHDLQLPVLAELRLPPSSSE
ncbi:MAG TPA: hypothetical protein VER96_32685 [Polyangiaceae bacterium]|nr:hypothetical protein [Polyangiaceae bacterium]